MEKETITTIKFNNLEERTLIYSKKVLFFTKSLRRTIENQILIKQFLRSATSIGANYREANETVTSKDKKYRIQICRKEAKETVYWIELLLEANKTQNVELLTALLKETNELLRIFATIHRKLN